MQEVSSKYIQTQDSGFDLLGYSAMHCHINNQLERDGTKGILRDHGQRQTVRVEHHSVPQQRQWW